MDAEGEMKLRALIAPTVAGLALVAFFHSGLAGDLWDRFFNPSRIVIPLEQARDPGAIGFMGQAPYQSYFGAWVQAIATLLAGLAALLAGALVYRGAKLQIRADHDLEIRKTTERRRRFATCLSVDLLTTAVMLEEHITAIPTLAAQPRADQAGKISTIRFPIPETIAAGWEDLAQIDELIVSRVRFLASGMRTSLHLLDEYEKELIAPHGNLQFHDALDGLRQNYGTHARAAREIRTIVTEVYGITAPPERPPLG